jgi:hypothetical protein
MKIPICISMFAFVSYRFVLKKPPVHGCGALNLGFNQPFELLCLSLNWNIRLLKNDSNARLVAKSFETPLNSHFPVHTFGCPLPNLIYSFLMQ